MKYLILAAVLMTGCSGANTPGVSSSPSSGGPTGISVSAADLAMCVNDLNGYRASVHLPALARSSALDAYAAQGAQIDGSSNAAHAHFASTNGGGVARVENELLNQNYGSVQAAIRALDSISWAEGPSGGHYRNMTGTYTQVGCGAFVQNGAITVVQDFH